MTEISELKGLMMDDLANRLRAWTRSEEFAMEQAVGELRIELQNTYPLSDPDNRSVRIKELWWNGDDSSLILWLHQVHDEWIVFDGARWQDDTDL